jgi:DNA-binding MarR family transcriptional regulator
MPLDATLGPEVCHCFSVRSAARHVTQFYDQLLEPTGLRITQYSILAMLKRLGPLTINALAKVLLTDRTTLGRNILPLERDGLIRIEQGASDRRAKELHLTTAGEKRLQASRPAWLKAQATYESSIGRKRAETLRALLRAIMATEFGGH